MYQFNVHFVLSSNKSIHLIFDSEVHANNIEIYKINYTGTIFDLNESYKILILHLRYQHRCVIHKDFPS